jgi:Zn-finger protein
MSSLNQTQSFVVISKETGKAVWECYNVLIAAKINKEKYTVKSSYNYLVDLNKWIKENDNMQIR